MRRSIVFGLLSFSSLVAGVAGVAGVAACGGGSVPAMEPSRSSGQSALMGKTFAGQNACNAKSHDRPFIIEWDATDMSMFESRAATDVIFVKYEGCDLKVLDGCANDAIRGAFGVYRPVEWTSGSIEKMDISNEGELYAKLPLGAATLGGRVQAGEKFKMEYFVSGVRTSTRPAVYRSELSKVPGCAGATHFVYGFAIGAFALASEKKVSGEAEVGVKGIGAGGKHATSQNADKKGGVIESCRADSAKDVKPCQVPIRLMLRDVAEGEAPAAPPGETAAGAPPARTDKPEMNMEEHKLRESAARKRAMKDGKGCLADFDEADRRFPSSARLSTRPDGMANVRAACLMLVGECEAGQKMLRMAYEKLGTMPASTIDTLVKIETEASCPKKK